MDIRVCSGTANTWQFYVNACEKNNKYRPNLGNLNTGTLWGHVDDLLGKKRRAFEVCVKL